MTCKQKEKTMIAYLIGLPNDSIRMFDRFYFGDVIARPTFVPILTKTNYKILKKLTQIIMFNNLKKSKMKKVILAMAVVALMASCSKDEVTNLNVNPDQISLVGTTTRATIANVSNLQTSGFTVYGTAANVADAWYSDGNASIDGANKHIYDGAKGTWNFTTPVKWPTDAAKYPMNFYAIYPEATSANGFSSLTATASTQTVTGTFSVKPTAAEQIDLLSATASAAAKPMSSSLSITFKHLLSKVDFGLNVATGHTAYVQGLAINNVSMQGLRKFTDASPSWGMIDGAYNKYTYDGTIYDSPTGNPTANALPVIPWAGTGTAKPIFSGVHSNHLMLMPQADNNQNWITTSPNTVEPDGKSHVTMMYRLAKAGDDNYIGYADASNHPAYAGSALKTANYTGALFVKVGYPFTLDWKEGKGYIYNITLPGSGGYLLDQNYYDENGNRTDLVVGDEDGDNNPDGPKVPEALTGDDYIHLIPVVSTWDDQPANALN
ncbi:MAG: fimbrillin family protein [Bacteroidales bacterium]|jgi:hypothetical protein|nr:fimbrillin family protein [Bacteroidales bacterium]